MAGARLRAPLVLAALSSGCDTDGDVEGSGAVFLIPGVL